MSASTEMAKSSRDPGVPLERKDIPQFVKDSLLHDPRRLVRLIPARELTGVYFWSGDTQEKVTLLVRTVGFWMEHFEKDTILRILPAILKDRLIERIFMLLHCPTVGKDIVGYFHTPYALWGIYRSLDGKTDLEKRAWTVFADNWTYATLMLYRNDKKKIWPDERHYDSIAILCQELVKSPVAFSRVITDKDNHTISVLVRYWTTIQDVKTQRMIELGLLSLVASHHLQEVLKSLEYSPDRQPHRQFIAALHDILGNSPGPAVVERMKRNMLLGGSEEDIGGITTGMFIALISAGEANRVDADLTCQTKAEFNCLKALVYATDFWEEYFYNMTIEAMKQPDSHLLPINLRSLDSFLSRVANIEKKWSKKVLVTWVKSGLFDYFDSVASDIAEEDHHAARASELLEMIRNTTKTSGSRVKRLIGDQMPRLSTLSRLAPHWISVVATSHQSANGLRRPNIATMNKDERAQMKCWMSFLDLQLLFMQPNRCSLRGCRAKGSKVCVGCGTRYCSLACQSRDWREHRSICQLAPILHSMIKWYKINKPFGQP